MMAGLCFGGCEGISNPVIFTLYRSPDLRLSRNFLRLGHRDITHPYENSSWNSGGSALRLRPRVEVTVDGGIK